MLTAQISIVASIGGISISATTYREGEGAQSKDFTLPAAKPGSLTTRTSDTAGAVTLAAGHGLVTGDKVAIFWEEGRAHSVELTLAGDVASFADTEGDALPALNAEVTVAKQIEAELRFEGDSLVAIVAAADKRASIVLATDAANVVETDQAASEAYTWIKDTGLANPYAAQDMTTVLAATADTAGDVNLKMATLEDSQPAA